MCINLATGVIPKLVLLIYSFFKRSWYKYKTGQYKCKPKNVLKRNETSDIKTLRELNNYKIAQINKKADDRRNHKVVITEKQQAEIDRMSKKIEDEVNFDRWCEAFEPFQYVSHMVRSGNSLFAAIAQCVYGNGYEHGLVRREILTFMKKK